MASSSTSQSGDDTIRFMNAALTRCAPLVAVTGGLGYLGSHVVARMLAKNYYVRTIVPQGASVDFLQALPGARERLQVIHVRDLAAEDARSSLLIAFRGVSTVVHAASFSTHSGKVPKTTISKRIVNALQIALSAAATAGNVVINFIYVSSELTVFEPSAHPRRKAAVLTEHHWYDCSKAMRETTHPFAYAHTVAEMRLWAKVGRGGLPFNVCSVVPSFLIGPVLSARQVQSTPSLSYLAALASGAISDVPDIPMSPVDVRDVARAITALMERPEISGRMLLCAEALTSLQLLARAQKEFPCYEWTNGGKKGLFRRSRPESPAIKALKSTDFDTRERRGRNYILSQQRVTDELGLIFRPLHETIRDTLISYGRHEILKSVPELVKQSVADRKSRDLGLDEVVMEQER